MKMTRIGTNRINTSKKDVLRGGNGNYRTTDSSFKPGICIHKLSYCSKDSKADRAAKGRSATVLVATKMRMKLGCHFNPWQYLTLLLGDPVAATIGPAPVCTIGQSIYAVGPKDIRLIHLLPCIGHRFNVLGRFRAFIQVDKEFILTA